MKILVIRHGQSEADILNVHEGRADFELTALGKRQAAATAKWVSENYAIDKIYASTLIRAKQTAQALSDKSGVEIQFLDELMEFNNGEMAGVGFRDARKQFPKGKSRVPHIAHYGMETEHEFRFRAEWVLSKIMHENTEKDVIAIVSHGGMINMLNRAFLRLPIDGTVLLRTGDACVHLWEKQGHRRIIHFCNYSPYDNA